MKALRQAIIVFVLFFFSCNNTSNQDDISRMIRTTHQILIFKNKIIRVQRPINEWDCCTSIQLLDIKGNILSEIPCNDGKYPAISIENDSIYINYSFTSNEAKTSMEPFEYYSETYTKLGDYKLYYRFNSDLAGGLSPEYFAIDSICRDSLRVYFFYNDIKIAEKNLQELFYDNNYCFYYYDIRDSVISRQYLEPTDSLLFIDYFQRLFQN